MRDQEQEQEEEEEEEEEESRRKRKSETSTLRHSGFALAPDLGRFTFAENQPHTGEHEHTTDVTDIRGSSQ